LLVAFFWQIRADLGITDNVWVDNHAAIAILVEDLGDQLRPAMQKGWLAYIKKTYSAYADEYEAADQVAVLRFLIIAIIVPIITIIANNSINRARIDTVAALLQSTNASSALLLLALSLESLFSDLHRVS
jgi:hypothetical protein